VRLGLAADIVVADVLHWSPAERFDAVLVDAPCTATGTLRRHPDVAWLKRERDIGVLAALQAALLRAGAALLKPGGRLVYATCSLLPAEGEAVAVPDLLAPDPWPPGAVPDLPQAITAAGTLRTRPDFWAERGGMDGFFAARFRRVA
jgi:16S rRNA (cytosine967-C5)-methyltransferase